MHKNGRHSKLITDAERNENVYVIRCVTRDCGLTEFNVMSVRNGRRRVHAAFYESRTAIGPRNERAKWMNEAARRGGSRPIELSSRGGNEIAPTAIDRTHPARSTE